MSKPILVALVALGVWGAWRWFVVRNRPEMPPLAIADDDPLMLDARQKAKDTIPVMIVLFEKAIGSTQVKVPFVTSSGVTEYLWAELLRVQGSRMHVRYITPPVSHTGKLERLHTHDLADIVDWLVVKGPKEVVGGYTMRVMFRRGREQWGELPQKLLDEEAKYGRQDD